MTDGASAALAQAVLDFWFADALRGPHAAVARSRTWFTYDPAFDAEIARSFGDLPAAAAAGALDAWADRPDTALARIVVLDQFPRNLYRDHPRAYAYDPIAVAAAQDAVDAGFDRMLAPLQAAFVYLPFEHSEDRAHQARAVQLFEALCARAPPGCEALLAGYAEYARRHRDVVERFGRFPHRNAVLGRACTAEESAYLAAGGERFGPKPD